MLINYKMLQRQAAALSALALLVGVAAPAVLSVPAFADQLPQRSIQMTDSNPGVSGVQYKLTFTTGATAGTTQDLIIDFCGDSPLPTTSCSYTAANVPTFSSPTASAGTITAIGTGSPVHTVQIKGLTIPGNATYTITITGGITNPSSAGSFYARVFTYPTNGSDAYVPANASGVVPTEGTPTDSGGIALSTTTPISITAKVQETMTLCTSGGTAATMPTPTAGFTGLNCAGFTAPAITLGGGTNYDVIDSSSIYRRSAWSQISTNATNGYAIYMRANNLCGGGLTKAPATDATCGIPAVNGGASSALAIIAGTAAFGVDVEDGVAESGGVGDNQAVAPWSTNSNNPTNQFVMDDTTSNNSVKTTNSPYGSKVIDTTAATVKQANSVTNEYKFGVTASPTTPSGIYQQQFSLIAVGLF